MRSRRARSPTRRRRLRATLEPWRERVEFVALGGDRTAVEAVLASRPELGWLRERALERFFTVPEPRQRVLESFPYDLYSVELVS